MTDAQRDWIDRALSAAGEYGQVVIYLHEGDIQRIDSVSRKKQEPALTQAQ